MNFDFNKRLKEILNKTSVGKRNIPGQPAELIVNVDFISIQKAAELYKLHNILGYTDAILGMLDNDMQGLKKQEELTTIPIKAEDLVTLFVKLQSGLIANRKACDAGIKKLTTEPKITTLNNKTLYDPQGRKIVN